MIKKFFIGLRLLTVTKNTNRNIIIHILKNRKVLKLQNQIKNSNTKILENLDLIKIWNHLHNPNA